MTALDCILEGLEAELALERELGVRTVEIDLALLKPMASGGENVGALKSGPAAKAGPSASGAAGFAPRAAAGGAPADTGIQSVSHRQAAPAGLAPPPPPARHGGSKCAYDFVFLHESPLRERARDMMEKIAKAMGRDLSSAPVVTEGEMPPARAYVVLGDKALRKWFPGKNAAPGQWIDGNRGEQALVTLSPEYIARFDNASLSMRKIKHDMWTSLKGVLQRVGG